MASIQLLLWSTRHSAVSLLPFLINIESRLLAELTCSRHTAAWYWQNTDECKQNRQIRLTIHHKMPFLHLKMLVSWGAPNCYIVNRAIMRWSEVLLATKTDKTFMWRGVIEGKHLYCCTLSVSLHWKWSYWIVIMDSWLEKLITLKVKAQKKLQFYGGIWMQLLLMASFLFLPLHKVILGFLSFYASIIRFIRSQRVGLCVCAHMRVCVCVQNETELIK